MSVRRPLLRDALAATAAAAATILLYVAAGRLGAPEAIASKEARAAALEAELRALTITANKLPEFKAEVAKLEHHAATLEQIRPLAPGGEAFLVRLRELSGRAGLDVDEARALAPAGGAVAVELKLRGTRAAFLDFLERLPNLARLNRVDRVEMQRDAGPGFAFTVRIAAFHKGR
jgi:hypothetical protein